MVLHKNQEKYPFDFTPQPQLHAEVVVVESDRKEVSFYD